MPWFEDFFAGDRVRTLSQQVSTLQDKVWELERKNTQLLGDKGTLEKQLEETKAAARAITSQKKEVERSLVAEIDKLGLAVSTAEKKYIKSEAEAEKVKKELSALAEANEAAMKAFNAEKTEMMLEAEELRRRVEELQSSKDLMEAENDKLRSEVLTAEQKHGMSEGEVERLKMELSALTEAKQAAVKAFDAQNAENMKELEDLKRKLEEIQTNNDLLEGENVKLQTKVLTTEQKHNMSEGEVERLKMELSALMEAKETAVKAFDAQNAENMKELEDLKRKLEEIQTNKDLLEGENVKLRTEVLTAEQKHNMSEGEVERLKMELSVLMEAKEAAVKAFDAQNAENKKELEDLKRKLEEIQTNKDSLEGENVKLRTEVLTVEQKHSMSEGEVERFKMELSALTEAKEVAMKTFDAQNAENMKELVDLKRKLEEIQTNKDLLEGENVKLRTEVLTAEQKHNMSEGEVERLKVELSALTEAKEAAVKAFDAQNAENMKELEDLKRKLEEIQTNKDLLEGENVMLRTEVLTAEQKYSMSEEEVERLKMELSALTEAKEVAVKAFDAQNAENMKKLKDLKRKLEEIQTNKDLLAGENVMLRTEVLTAEQKHSMSEGEVERLKMELSALTEAKEAVVKAFDAQNAENMKELEDLKRKLEEIQTNKDLLEVENVKLRMEVLTVEQKHSMSEGEVKRLKMELSALTEAKEEAVKAFDAEKVEIMKELDNLKRKIEETQSSKDLVEFENDELRSEISNVKHEYSLLKAEVKNLTMELEALEVAKEAAAKTFDGEKEEILKEVEDLKRKMEGIQVTKEAAEKAWRDKNAEVNRLCAELATIHIFMSQLQASYDRLDAKHSRLNEEKDSVQKALDAEKVEACKLKSKIEQLESHNTAKDGEIGKLKAALEEKKSEVDALSKDVEQLRLAVAEAEEKNKSIILSSWSEKTILSNQKRELEKQLVEQTRASQVSASQVFTLGLKVRELECRNNELSGDLVKQREDTRKAGLLFMEAADRYQQAAKKHVRAKVAELEDARKASVVIMNAADAYQDAAKKETRAKVEELEDMKAAVLVLMSAADMYQQEAKKRIMENVEELKILREQKAEMDARAASLESELSAALSKSRKLEAGYDSVKGENDELRSEVERLVMEFGALPDVGGEAHLRQRHLMVRGQKS